MPTVGKPQYDPETELRIRRMQFIAVLKRSTRGNLWCEYDGKKVAVFKREDGLFDWCIADTDVWGWSDNKRFAPQPYDNEADAAEAVAREVVY